MNSELLTMSKQLDYPPTDLSPKPVTVSPSKQRHQRDIPKPIVAACGHKVDTGSLPSTNCQVCWNAFMWVNMDMTKQNLAVMEQGRAPEITAAHGSKYVKHLARFAYMVAMIMEQKAKEEDGN